MDQASSLHHAILPRASVSQSLTTSILHDFLSSSLTSNLGRLFSYKPEELGLPVSISLDLGTGPACCRHLYRHFLLPSS